MKKKLVPLKAAIELSAQDLVRKMCALKPERIDRRSETAATTEAT
jgi:hypothetical protein